MAQDAIRHPCAYWFARTVRSSDRTEQTEMSEYDVTWRGARHP